MRVVTQASFDLDDMELPTGIGVRHGCRGDSCTGLCNGLCRTLVKLGYAPNPLSVHTGLLNSVWEQGSTRSQSMLFMLGSGDWSRDQGRYGAYLWSVRSTSS